MKHGHLKKKIGSLLLAAVLVAGTAPNSVPVRVLAQEENGAHSHKICAGSTCADDSHEDVEWKALTYTDGKLYADGVEIKRTMSGYELADGNYYLADNLTLEYQICIQNADVHLCLNGKTLTITKSGIWIYGNGRLTLCDCAGGGQVDSQTQQAVGIPDITSGDRSFTMYAGSIHGTECDFLSRDYEGIEAKFLGGSVDNMKVELPATYQQGGGPDYMGKVLTTPIYFGQPVKQGTKIKVDFSWTEEWDGELPDVPVVQAAEGYTLTETDLANLDIEVIASGYTDTEFQKKIENGVIVLYRHSHNLIKKAAVPATCETQGTGEYWKCEGTDGCGKMFSDEAGTTEITLDDVKTDALGHNYDTSTWGYKGTDGHAHTCSRCGEHDTVVAHTEDSGTKTKLPTETETGICTYKCTVCGKELRTETIPATGTTGDDKGKISTDIEKGENAPTVKIPASNELANMLLTPEEKQQVEKGTDIRIVLKVEDASKNVSGADKVLIESALKNGAADGYSIGQYLDINLIKIIGGNNSSRISKTNSKIKIAITVPEALRNTDSGRTRTFAVIRVHDGKAELLNDIDSRADTITIETDRFSTYGIVYKDSGAAPTVTPSPQPTNKPSPLLLATGKQTGKNAIKLNWLKCKNISGYEVYSSYCDGKSNYKKVKTIKATGKRTWTHRKLKKNRVYKYFIAAYKMENGKKITIAKSPVIHVAMKNAKQTNVKSIRAKKTKITLKKGKTFQIKAKIKRENGKKKALSHAAKLRYYTDNGKIAAVSRKGKITAKGKGICRIYVIANNGVSKKIKVTVK